MKWNKTDLERIKQELTIRKIELERELQSLSSEQMVDEGSKDESDQVVSITMETLRNSLQDTQYQEYSNILAAIEAINKGTYGICQECGQQISENRLKYNPNARRCLPCQEKAEGKEFR
jgi:DnaK suppressor protein